MTRVEDDDTTDHVQGKSHHYATRDGRALHAVELSGPAEAAATVVFEAGAAANRSSWGLVQPSVGAFARSVAYDRAGMGQSPPDPAGRTIDRMADDLNDLLDGLGDGPFVLVGHSAGGPIARLAASRKPDRIRGLVLVDPTDEGGDVLFGRAFRIAEKIAIRVLKLLARTGRLPRMFGWLTDAMPPDVRADMRREAFTPSVIDTQAAQARTFLDEIEQWRITPPDLGDLPVTVISGGRPGHGMGPKIRAIVNDSHAKSAATSPHGRHVIAEESDHYVPVTEPGVIVDEIRRLVQD